jgi:hypothetical protein
MLHYGWSPINNRIGTSITGGIKIVDPRAVDPSTGNLLGIQGKFQSRDLSFVSQLAFVKDCKQTYKDCFGVFFSVFNGGQFVIPETDNEPELSNFEITSCQDTSSGWKSTQLGGGCKSMNHFCSYVWCQARECAMAYVTITDATCALR